MNPVTFQLLAADGDARTGVASVRGRSFRTPAFMPVGTAGAVKALSSRDLRAAGVEILLANTLHLRLRPGPERVRALGGLHRFLGFDGAILTDSGGYQVFSLADRARLDEDGVTFRSHLDGERVHLGPEEAMRIQADLDPDVALVLDQPVALPAERQTVLDAAARTLRWARRCLEWHRRHVDTGQALFCIVQGAVDVELRLAQAEQLVALEFDGYAVGGLAVGEGHEAMKETLGATLPRLPRERLRYVMGVGYPRDLLAAIGRGADLFDCVLPTRHARTGQAFTSNGVVRLRNAAERSRDAPLDPDCRCEACATVSRAYLSHLYHAGEMLGPILVARHNVAFYERLVHDAGEAVRDGRFAAFAAAFLERSGEEARG